MIRESSQVTFHFTLKNQNQELIDSSYEREEAISFTIGKNELMLAKLEEAFLEKDKGDQFEISLEASEAFGPRDDNRFQIVSLDKIESDDHSKPTLGEIVFLKSDHEEETSIIESAEETETNLPEKIKTSFLVTGILNERAALDGNHPLAGLDLHFNIEILDVINETLVPEETTWFNEE